MTALRRFNNGKENMRYKECEQVNVRRMYGVKERQQHGRHLAVENQAGGADQRWLVATAVTAKRPGGTLKPPKPSADSRGSAKPAQTKKSVRTAK